MNSENGFLGLPKIDINKISLEKSIQTKLILFYDQFFKSAPIAQKILDDFSKDERILNLSGKLLSTGYGGIKVEVINFAMWYLWAQNEFGVAIAEQNLNAFLKTDKSTIINTLWVLGVELENRIDLENGYSIVPIKDMQSSVEKENYIKHNPFGLGLPLIPKPTAAITHSLLVSKIFNEENLKNTAGEIQESTAGLYDIALVLNALNDISCIPFFLTQYTPYDMPLGLFSGGGGGTSPIFDIYGFNNNKISMENYEKIQNLVKSFKILDTNKKYRWERILSRISQSKRRGQIEDKILDLGIALEMALLEDNKNHDQLSLTFKMRGSWLIGESTDARKILYKKLSEIYNFRSQVAHAGTLCKNNAEKINQVKENFSDYCNIAENTLQKLLENPDQDWTGLILGV